MNMMSYLEPDMRVCNFDDFYIDPANGLNWLFYLKGIYPTFKVTLFTIPFRSRPEWLREVKKHDWIELALHGFVHEEEETFKLTPSEIKGYLDDLEQQDLYVKGFKGANWKVSEAIIDILRERGYWLAVKEPFADPIKQWPLTDPRVTHGHIWMMETHNKEKKLDFGLDSDFRFISEVIDHG